MLQVPVCKLLAICAAAVVTDRSDKRNGRRQPYALNAPPSLLEERLPKQVASVVDCLLEQMKQKPYKDRIELMQGTLDMLVLRTLQWGPQHGHGIGQAIRASSADALQIEHGSLYPALHRLERQGWLKAEWKSSEANRRAKYYSLTAAGKKQLAAEESKWNALVATIALVMKPT